MSGVLSGMRGRSCLVISTAFVVSAVGLTAPMAVAASSDREEPAGEPSSSASTG